MQAATRRRMAKTFERTYELRQGRLYLNGERLPVDPETVAVALLLYEEPEAALLRSSHPRIEIPASLGRLILLLESRRARRDLALSLAPVLCA